jgi:serine/threonine protein phosphatase PrpC
MQGWRKRMEDAHMICLDLGPNKDTNLFGIFDGHGGCEVALFVGHHFAEEFIKNENYLNNDIKTALESNYLKMDEMMLSESGRQELISECKKSKEENAKLRENTKNSQIEMLREVIDPKEQPDAKISMFTATTIYILCIKEKKLFFAKAGDSISVLCKNGDAFSMNFDDKPEIPSK